MSGVFSSQCSLLPHLPRDKIIHKNLINTKYWAITVRLFLSEMSHTVFRVRRGPGNPGKYLNFSLASSMTGNAFKMVGSPGNSWKFK